MRLLHLHSDVEVNRDGTPKPCTFVAENIVQVIPHWNHCMITTVGSNDEASFIVRESYTDVVAMLEQL